MSRPWLLGGLVCLAALAGLWQAFGPARTPSDRPTERHRLAALAIGFDGLDGAEITAADGEPPPLAPDWLTAMQRLGAAYGAHVVRCRMPEVSGDGVRLWLDERDASPSMRWAWLGEPVDPLRGYPRAYDRVVETPAGHLFLVEAGTDSAYVQWPGGKRGLVTWAASEPGTVADCTGEPLWQPTTTLRVRIAHDASVEPGTTTLWGSCGLQETTPEGLVEVEVVTGPCHLAGHWSHDGRFGRLQAQLATLDAPTELTLEGHGAATDSPTDLAQGLAWIALYQDWLDEDTRVLDELLRSEADAAVLLAYQEWRDALASQAHAYESGREFLSGHLERLAGADARPPLLE